MISTISIPEAAPLDPSTSELRVLGWLLRYGFRYKRFWALLLLATMLMAVSAGYLVVLVREILVGMQAAQLGTAGALRDLYRLGLWALVVAPASALAYGGAWLLGQHLANSCTRDLRNDLLSHLVELDLGFHQRVSRGDLLSRLTSDIDVTGELFQQIFGKVLQRPAEAIGTVAFLFYLNWIFASVVFLILAPVAVALSFLLRKASRRSRRARRKQAESFTALEQITAGIRVIKAMGSAEAERARYDRANAAFYAAKMRIAVARAQSDALIGGLPFALIGLVVLGGAVVISHRIGDGPSIIAFITALIRLTQLLRNATKSSGEVQEALPAAVRLYALLKEPSQIVDLPSAKRCPVPRREICFENVCFGYAPTSDVLRGLTLTVPIGKVTALVGESGAGKSTLFDLLLRLRDVRSGCISIDGVDIRTLQQDSLVQQFSLVSQDLFLFNDTVGNNIKYGRPSATHDEVVAAAKRANIHDVILSLPGDKGYDTVVGDRGDRLSGGQRQRISIARAILRDAPVLLLDEPTSALDAQKEHQVQVALRELMRGRTCIVIAHRLATVQHADQIFVLSREKGQVVESGTHTELIDRDGEYARLVQMQQLVRSREDLPTFSK